jgi:hypothetical protein
MGIFRGPNFTRNGLVLSIDAGSYRSYIGNGTSVKDVSRNGKNGTLTNGASFNSSNGGVFSFDGVDDYISIPNSSTINPNSGSFSIICWVNSDPSNDGDSWDLWVGKRSGGSNGYYVGANNPSGVRFMIGNDANSRTDTGFISYTFNTWAMFTAILNRTDNTQTIIRNNYEETAVTTPSGGNYYNTGTLSIGGDIGVNAYYVNGKIGNVLMYNTALTPERVGEIFNATKKRYGL